MPFTMLMCLFVASIPAWAGPTTTPLTEADAEIAPAAVARDSVPQKGGTVDSAAMRDVPNQSNTIKMLLELQAAAEPSASASDSGRPPPRSAGSRAGTQTPAANPFGKADNPFGASPEFARPAAASGVATGSVDWQAASNSGGFSGVYGGATGVSGVAPDQHLFPAQRAGGSSGGDAAEPRWWMPSAWIRWVREHRQEVLIGAAVALALAWAGASRTTPRRS